MKKYILILTALTVLSSCRKDTDSPSGGLPMRVDASLSATKAGLTTADLQEFWLQVDCPSDASYSYFGKVSRSGTAWSAGRQLYWRDETTPISYTAAYFGGHSFTGAEFTGGVDLAVPSDQSTQALLSSADLLTLKATSTSYEATTDGTLPVELGHALSRLKLEVILDSQFYDRRYGRTDNPVTSLTVTGSRLGFGFLPATGAVSAKEGTEADITPFALSYTPGSAGAKTATAVYEAILVPQTFAAGDLTVSFSVGANGYAWTNGDAVTLAAGQTVTLPVSVTAAPPIVQAFVDMGEVEIKGVKKNLKWATCNVGAENPWDYGDYYAWGETETYYEAGTAHNMSPTWKSGKRDGYNWLSYKWCNGAYNKLNKYCTNYECWDISNFAPMDNKTVLDPEDDVAHVKWGGTWRIPTDEEWTALRNTTYYTWTWTDNYVNGTEYTGVAGWNVTRNNVGGNDPCAGKSIFLPAAGFRHKAILGAIDSGGSYWSSSLNTTLQPHAWSVNFDYLNVRSFNDNRSDGLSVRPVFE